jgi:translocation and assembly module TamB
MSEGGTLTFAGEALVAQDGSVRATGTVRGDRFELMDNPDGRIVVTPDLELAAIGDSLRVRGTVLVPIGFIHAGTTSETVVRPSHDVVLVTPAGTVDRHDPNLIAEVRVTMGDDVHVDTYGLKSKIEGGLLVLDRPGWPSSGAGELQLVQGTYRAYGQNLQIERGRLRFGGGPLKNPGLDVRATRTAGDGTVAGFEVRGTLEAPQLTVVSEPPLTPQDALGYILFGRPMQSATTNEQAMVRDAGDVLGVAGSSALASNIAHPLGLDEASVQSKGGLNQASLMLGRYLSPRLYINYGIGILDQVSTVRLRYTLSRMWTIQAESGNETRGQVQYTVER